MGKKNPVGVEIRATVLRPRACERESKERERERPCALNKLIK